MLEAFKGIHDAVVFVEGVGVALAGVALVSGAHAVVGHWAGVKGAALSPVKALENKVTALAQSTTSAVTNLRNHLVSDWSQAVAAIRKDTADNEERIEALEIAVFGAAKVPVGSAQAPAAPAPAANAG